MKKKIETSKLFCGIVMIFSIVCTALCFVLAFLGYPVPETLGVTVFGMGVVDVLGYLFYNGANKNSRNKYGIDVDGVPFSVKKDVAEDEENEY